MENLKKCACGGEAKLRSYRTYSETVHGMVAKYYVKCSCNAEVPELGDEDKYKAISEWNEAMK